MKRRGYPVGDTLGELCAEFGVSFDDLTRRVVKPLLKEGYTIKGICYGIGRGRAKLHRLRSDERFFFFMINEVRKYSLKPGDPRWGSR